METVTLAGGCFWCTEAIFKRLKGIESVTSGYSGGKLVINPKIQKLMQKYGKDVKEEFKDEAE